jgi:hypothetical protein
VKDALALELRWCDGHMALGDAQFTAMSEDQDLCAVDGKNETYGMSGRLYGRTRASIHGRGPLGGYANKEQIQSPRSIRWLKREEHGSETLMIVI